MSAERENDTVAVLDVGKTNIKLTAATDEGAVLETLSIENPVRNGSPWRHHDLRVVREWLFEGLAQLAERYPLEAFVASGHGSGGVLVLDDPEAGDGAALPMIDYEQPLPEAIRRAYGPLSGTFFDRGSATMHGATHQARQLYWMQQAEPEAFAKARWFLGVPQYWAWVLSGTAVSEKSVLGAQSHLWNVAEGRWAPIVDRQDWQHLMPPFAPAWQTIGRIRPELAERHGLPKGLRVLAGGHDSSLNYYRYQAAGLKDVTLVSTGTWIVGFSARTPLDRLDENRGMTCNSDVFGNPLGGVLSMGGREFAAIAGADTPASKEPREAVARLVACGVMALPSFGADDGLFPGSSGRGRFVGGSPETPEERTALAIIYCALLTVECLDALGENAEVVLDGSFLRDPLYAALVAGFARNRRVRFSTDAHGVTSGAALLAGHEKRTRPAPVELSEPGDLGDLLSMLPSYASRWRMAAQNATTQ